MNNKPSIALTTTSERPQNKTCDSVPMVIRVGNHTFIASGFHFHIPNQTDAGDHAPTRGSHIGVGADMDQVIEILINPKPHYPCGLSTFQQPHNTIIKMN